MYGLVYLVMEGKVAFTGTQIKGLQGYLERGGALLVECCNEAARAAFVEVTTQIGAGLQRIPKDHPLMTQPYLFAAPPQGYEKTGELLVGEGVVLSTFNYGLVLAGEAGPEGSPPSRETIRAVVEWLVNVLRYTSERRAEA